MLREKSVIGAKASVVLAVLATLILAGTLPIFAEEARKLPTVGLAIPVDAATDAPYQKAFRDGLQELGWVDGRNVTLIVRYSNGDPVKLRNLIDELIALRVDVLWGEAPALKQATSTIPIVSPTMGDPVKTGLVASLARPGGNLTGVSKQSYDIWPKQLELAKEVVPNLRRLCFLFDTAAEPDAPASAHQLTELAAGAGITVRVFPVDSPTGLQAALKAIRRERPQVLMVWSSPLMTQHRRTIMEAVAHRMPVITDGQNFAQAGALLTYSVDWLDMFRRSAAYVDKILKGARPGDLPIEQPTKFNLVVNLKTATMLNIEVPETILVRADEVIR